jgi:hypothetical protein
MRPSGGAMVSRLLALAFLWETLRTAAWLGRILSLAPVYDAPVFVLAGARAMVATVQISAAWMLWRGAPPGRRFAQTAVLLSALLLTLEVGVGLAPSSVPPGQRVLVVAAYGAYAIVVTWLLRKPEEPG